MTGLWIAMASTVPNFRPGTMDENSGQAALTLRSAPTSHIEATRMIEEWRREVELPGWTFTVLRIPGT